MVGFEKKLKMLVKVENREFLTEDNSNVCYLRVSIFNFAVEALKFLYCGINFYA